MCLAILKTVESHITRKTLRNGFRENSDGAGFMYVKNERLIIQKGYFSFRSFYKAFRKAEKENQSSNFVIHFRLATSGLIDANTCHPFVVNNNTGFVHNGIFTGLGNKTMSDTQEFNYKELRHLSNDFIYDAKILDAIKTKIGMFNKLIFLNKHNHYFIVNENSGHWENGCWLSTYDYEEEFTYYEEESIVWDNCIICGGFYPRTEMSYIGGKTFACDKCYLPAKDKTTCFYCGGIIEDGDEVCYRCGIKICV